MDGVPAGHAFMTPDRSYPDRKDLSIRPSWSANPGYLNEGHRRVFEETKDIPGWQMEADSYKLCRWLLRGR